VRPTGATKAISNDSPFTWGNFDCVSTLILNVGLIRLAGRAARKPPLDQQGRG
jgi:hypothetical protein